MKIVNFYSPRSCSKLYRLVNVISEKALEQQWEECERLREEAVAAACEALGRKLRIEFDIEKELAIAEALNIAKVLSVVKYFHSVILEIHQPLFKTQSKFSHKYTLNATAKATLFKVLFLGNGLIYLFEILDFEV